MMPCVLVFGYASLTALDGRHARLRGWRRTWGVAMDNRVAIPGYKAYVDPRTGARPPVHVAFLDVVEDPAGVVDGVLLDVDPSALALLDARERNYERLRVEVEGEEAWIYRGTADGRRRFEEGLAAGTLVVHDGYLALVGGAEAPPCAVAALRRVELPPSSG